MTGRHRLMRDYDKSEDVRYICATGDLVHTVTPARTVASVGHKVNVGTPWKKGEK